MKVWKRKISMYEPMKYRFRHKKIKVYSNIVVLKVWNNSSEIFVLKWLGIHILNVKKRCFNITKENKLSDTYSNVRFKYRSQIWRKDLRSKYISCRINYRCYSVDCKFHGFYIDCWKEVSYERTRIKSYPLVMLWLLSILAPVI